MISISTLYCGNALSSHDLRYGSGAGRPGPVTVFNCTMRCNLRCRHCYSSNPIAGGELTTQEAETLIDELAGLGTPVILFSGGEPVMRQDLGELMAYAAGHGIRSTISTNGTLITPAIARQFADIGVGYVGISIDGLKRTHDAFRHKVGSFEQALSGIANCQAEGLKVGLRMTLTAYNVNEIGGVFDLMAQRGIPRICFYHLVYTGRGSDIRDADLPAPRRREAIDLILDRTAASHRGGRPVEVLTVDNHCDGPYLYMRLLREDPHRAEQALALLKANGGNASGVRLVCVKSNGDVYPDQFWQTQLLGNIRVRPFSRIWNDPDNRLLADLRRRPRPLVGPRCSKCKWLAVCNGNFRARAEATTGVWGDDPACYLTDQEIGLTQPATRQPAATPTE